MVKKNVAVCVEEVKQVATSRRQFPKRKKQVKKLSASANCKKIKPDFSLKEKIHQNLSLDDQSLS